MRPIVRGLMALNILNTTSISSTFLYTKNKAKDVLL